MATGQNDTELEITLGAPSIAVSRHTVTTVERADTWYNTRTGKLETNITKTEIFLDDISATFVWSGLEEEEDYSRYSYKLEFCKKDNFIGSIVCIPISIQLIGGTAVEDPSGGIRIVGGSTSGKITQDARAPISILASLGNNTTDLIYWRVVARKEDGSGLITSEAGTFSFVDNEGVPLWTDMPPAQASVINMSVGHDVDGDGARICNGELTFTVTSKMDGFGIAKYEVVLKNKTTGESRPITVGYDENVDWLKASGNTNYFTQSVNLKLEEWFGDGYEGDYVISVKTSDACGHSTNSSETEFSVSTDMPDPVTMAEELPCAVLSVLVSWDALSGGAEKYVIRTKKSDGGWQDALTVKGNVTSAIVTLPGDGTYEFSVVAENKSGNRLAHSETREVAVSKEGDYADTYDECTQLSWTEDAIKAENTIGWGDTADYFYFKCGVSCTVSVDLSDLEEYFDFQKSRGIKFEFYKYDGSGKEKPIKTISVTSAKTIISDLKLYGGTYFAKVTANDTSVVEQYRLDFVKTDFSTSEFNTAKDDDWTKLEEQGYIPVAAGGTVRDWVGFGDAIDYRKLKVAASGNYSFGLEAEGSPVSLTIYQDNDGVLKKLKTISSGSGINATTMLLDKNNEYYISVSPSGDNSDYTVGFECLHAYDDGNQKINNDDDDWKMLDTKGFAPITGEEEEPLADWVGFSDTIDYRKIKVTHAGCYDLNISGISHKVVYTVYQQVGEDKLQKIASLTLSPRDGKTAAGKISHLYLDSGTNSTVYPDAGGAVYYVSISAPDGNLEKNSNYTLSLSCAEEFISGNNADDDWRNLPDVYTISTDESVDDEWIGLGDKIDYRKIVLSASGSYDFTISEVSAPVILSVYQKIGDDELAELVKIASKTVTAYEDTLANVVLDFDHRDSGTYSYYLAVECQKYDGRNNSDYRLEMTGPKFDKARCEDDWSDLAVNGELGNVGDFETIIADQIGTLLVRKDNITGEQGRADNWVGYGDAVDYVKFELNCAAKLVFDLETEGNAALTVYSLLKGGSGYSLKQLGTAGNDLWLEKGKYYIAVKTLDQSVNADIDYAVKVSSGEFFTKSNTGNTDDTWQKAWKNQSALEVFKSDMDPVKDWVGFGNGADYWKLQFQDDGWLKIALDEDTVDAYKKGEISFKLCSSDQGKALALAWDEASDCFISKDDFAAGNICCFGVVCNDVKKYSVDYKLTFAVKTLQ